MEGIVKQQQGLPRGVGVPIPGVSKDTLDVALRLWAGDKMRIRHSLDWMVWEGFIVTPCFIAQSSSYGWKKGNKAQALCLRRALIRWCENPSH